MVDSGTCDICGNTVETAQADMDIETGSLVHAACLEQKHTADRQSAEQLEAEREQEPAT